MVDVHGRCIVIVTVVPLVGVVAVVVGIVSGLFLSATRCASFLLVLLSAVLSSTTTACTASSLSVSIVTIGTRTLASFLTTIAFCF